jgi:hypothetical protein
MKELDHLHQTIPNLQLPISRVHRADSEVASARTLFDAAMHVAARALAPFQEGAEVQSNAGPKKGKRFTATSFSLMYSRQTKQQPQLIVEGPRVTAPDSPAHEWVRWEGPTYKLTAFARLEADDEQEEPLDPTIPVQAHPAMWEYMRLTNKLWIAGREGRAAYTELHETLEDLPLRGAPPPFVAGKEIESPEAVHRLLGQRIYVESVMLRSRFTGEPWCPGDLVWVAKGRRVAGRFWSADDAPLQWTQSVYEGRKKEGEATWQPLRP